MKYVGLTTVIVTAAAAIVIAMTAVSHAAPVIAAGNPVKGKILYAREKCDVCHRINGAGAAVGPDLSAVGTRRTAASLAKFLPNPTPINPKKPPAIKMPPVNVKGQDLEDVIAYLLTLKGK